MFSGLSRSHAKDLSKSFHQLDGKTVFGVPIYILLYTLQNIQMSNLIKIHKQMEMILILYPIRMQVFSGNAKKVKTDPDIYYEWS